MWGVSWCNQWMCDGIVLVILVAALVPTCSACGCERNCVGCRNRSPCVDLLQGSHYHHYMTYVSQGRAEVFGANNQGDNRRWSCTCSSCVAGSLRGIWSCPGFYNSRISITSDTAPDNSFFAGCGRLSCSTIVCLNASTTAPTAMPTEAPTGAPSTSTTTTTTTHTVDQSFRREDAFLRAEIGRVQSQLRAEFQSAISTLQSTVTAQSETLALLNHTTASLRAAVRAAASVSPQPLPPIFSGYGPGNCIGGDCSPRILADPGETSLTLTAPAGTVAINTATCGQVDLCALRGVLRNITLAMDGLTRQ